MTPYFATATKPYMETLLSLGEDYRLLFSYYYIKKDKLENEFDRLFRNDPKIFFMDSGAFTVFNKKEPLISINDYMASIRRLKPFVFIAMDVIGNPEATYQNTRYMWQEGCKAMPVVHTNGTEQEVVKYTEKYLKMGVDYIAVGLAGAPYSHKPTQVNLRVFWRIIKEVWPIKVHLFGKFDYKWLIDFPYYSCDSSSWMEGGRWGSMVEHKPHFSGVQKIHEKDVLQARNKVRDLRFRQEKVLRNVVKYPGIRSSDAGFYNQCILCAVGYYKQMQKITNYWASKGVVWTPPPKTNLQYENFT